MTYPASPDDAASRRVRPDPAQFWAGAGATAVVAALIALVGILICRWTLTIPILAPAGAGAWGDASTGVYALVAALIAIVAAGLLYLLMLGAPQPGLFFDWIMGLATLAAVVYPFSTGAALNQKGATAVVNLVLGVAITSLLTGVAARAIRRVPPPPVYRDGAGYEYGHGPEYGYGYGYLQKHGYGPDERYPERGNQRYPEQGGQRYPERGDQQNQGRGDQRYPERGDQRYPDRGNVPEPRADQPTQPINEPRRYRR